MPKQKQKLKQKKRMQSNLKKLNKIQIKVTVDLDQGDLQKYIDKAEDIFGGEVEIKGFRRGKAPKDVVREHINQEEARALALEIAVEKSLSDVVKDNSLDVLDTSQLSIEKNDATQLKYSIVLDLFPQVELVDLGKIKVKRTDVKVEEKEVEDALAIIKSSKASFVDKDNNGAVENGDRVEVDFEVRKDGQIIEGGVSKNHPLVIGGRNFMPGFEDQLVGMRKGESRSFTLTAPSDYFYKDVAGKKLEFSVKVNDIKKVVTPEANDDFAKTMGRFASLGELRKSIKNGLTQEKALKENQKLRLEILDNIIRYSRIDVPEDLLKKQVDTMMSDFDHTLHEKGLELGLYLARIGKTQEKLREDWVKDAEKQVKISLILRKIAKDNNIKASQEEIEETANQVIQSALLRGEIEQADIDPIKIKKNLASGIVNEKTLDYIESRCAV